MSVSSSLKLSTNPLPEDILAPLCYLGQGMIPPYSSKRRNAPADMHKKLFKKSLICAFSCTWPQFLTLQLRLSIHKIILWVPISPLPGHIYIYHIPRLQTISLRKTITICSRAQKAINLNFFPLWMNLLKTESILRGRRTSAGFYEPVRAVLRDVSATPYLFLCGWWWRLGSVTLIDCCTIINVHENPCLRSAAYIVGFLRSIGDR